ncbi:MAG TPA: LD-carboxypeptidase [Micavibrio sp.]
MTIKPAALRKGDLIGIMSSSSIVEKAEVAPGLKILEDRGFQVHVHPQTWHRFKSVSGASPDKVSALQELWKRRDMKAIFMAGGGNRATHLLFEDIDYAMIRRNPKIMMGFSDVTILLNAFNARAALTTFHGPVVKWLARTENLDHVFDVLAGQKVAYPMEDAAIVHKGTAHGPLVGGNLFLFQDLIGTKFMPRLDGAILFLEDAGDQSSRVDRTLAHLRLTGMLHKLAGIVFGQFNNSEDTGKKPYGFTMDEIIAEHTSDLKIPVVMNAPFGHSDTLYAMPVGCPARLTARGGRIRFSLSEPAVRV